MQKVVDSVVLGVFAFVFDMAVVFLKRRSQPA